MLKPVYQNLKIAQVDLTENENFSKIIAKVGLKLIKEVQAFCLNWFKLNLVDLSKMKLLKSTQFWILFKKLLIQSISLNLLLIYAKYNFDIHVTSINRLKRLIYLQQFHSWKDAIKIKYHISLNFVVLLYRFCQFSNTKYIKLYNEYEYDTLLYCRMSNLYWNFMLCSDYN